MKILVTGSAGFVGSDLVPRLRQAGHTVVGIDILPETHSDRFVQHDLTKPLSLVLDGYELCIHLASAVGGIVFNVNRTDIGSINEDIEKTVLDLCTKSKIKKMVFFSSINVFEKSLGFRHERLGALDQVTAYAISKGKSERKMEGFFNDLLVIRPTNLFGRNQLRRHSAVGESHVIPDLLHKIETQTVLEVLGDGTQVRNFVHVSDVNNFLVKNLGFHGQHFYNLRSDITVSIKQLTEQLMRIQNKNLEIRFNKEFMKYEVFKIESFDMSAPKADGWQTKINSLADGLTVLEPQPS